MTHYTVITARPVMKAFESPKREIEIEGDPLAAMLADAKKVNRAFRKSQGLSDQAIAAQVRANGGNEGMTCRNALLGKFLNQPIYRKADLVRDLGLKDCTIIRGIKLLRLDGYEITTTRPPEGSTYHFHGKQEAS